MPMDMDTNPREFLIIVLAIGIKIFGNKPWSSAEHFQEAEKFIGEAESKYGRLNPR